MSKSTRRLIYGALIHCVSLRELQALPQALIAIGEDGVIQWLEPDVEGALLQSVVASKGWNLEDVHFIELPAGQWIMPGFVDTHTHAPQYPNLGSGQQYELLDWLKYITFPTEARFKDLDYARATYTPVIQRVINCGTTTCCYYGTLHLEATKILANIALAKGQRSFIGKCNMDRNASPTYEEESVEQSLADTKSLVAHIKSLNPPGIVHPILTPRFAIACSSPLLAGLGEMAAADPDLAIQTHISENAAEIAFTRELFPDCPSYAGVYDHFGLLRKKTILAHGVHLDDDELELIRSKGAGISHCPTSNLNLRSGVANVGAMLDRGINVGLGTDVSGGYSPSMLTAVQHASICSKIHAQRAPSSPLPAETFTSRQLPLATLLYLATMGGAEVCGLNSVIGNFLPGKEFDGILVDMRHNDISQEQSQTLVQLLERFLFCGDDRNISVVWVKNKVVGGRDHSQGNPA